MYYMNVDILESRNEILRSAIKGVVEVPLLPFNGAKMRYCNKNVESYIKEFGGEAVTGYLVSSLGFVIVRLVGHVVVRKDGKLFCVTPPEIGGSLANKTILFKSECFDYSDRLPVVTKSLVSDKVIEEYVGYENRYQTIRMSIPFDSPKKDGKLIVPVELEDELITVTNGIHKLQNEVFLKAFLSLDRNNSCACGSSVKYKECCEKMIKKCVR